MQNPRSVRSANCRGFTIIELMVATVTFSVVIMTVGMAIAQMSRLYQKSIYMSRAQAATRTLVDVVGESVQFRKTVITTGAGSGAKAYCIGQKQYVYILGGRVGTDVSAGDIPHALMVGDAPLGPCIPPVDYATTHQDMLGAGLRLSAFTVSTTIPTTITVAIAYGSTDDIDNPASANVSCKGGMSSTYCGVSKLKTVVQGRIY